MKFHFLWILICTFVFSLVFVSSQVLLVDTQPLSQQIESFRKNFTFRTVRYSSFLAAITQPQQELLEETFSTLKLYEKSSYLGTSIALRIDNETCTNLSEYSDKVNSLEKGSGCVRIHEDSDCQGVFQCICKSVPDLSKVSTGGLNWGHEVSSLSFCDTNSDLDLDPTFTVSSSFSTSSSSVAKYFDGFGRRFCLNLEKSWTNKVTSVDSHDTCIKIWSGENCHGDYNTLTKNDGNTTAAEARVCQSPFNLTLCGWSIAGGGRGVVSISDCIHGKNHLALDTHCTDLGPATSPLVLNCILEVWTIEIDRNKGALTPTLKQLIDSRPNIRQTQVAQLVSKIYANSLSNAPKILRLAMSLQGSNENLQFQFEILQHLFEEMRNSNSSHINSPQFVMFAQVVETCRHQHYSSSDQSQSQLMESLWRKIPEGVRSLVGDVWVRIESRRHPGYTLYGSKAGNIYTYPSDNYAGGKNQKWRVLKSEENFPTPCFRFRNLENDNFLYVDDKGNTRGGERRSDGRDLWIVTPVEEGQFFYFRNKQNGRVLDSNDLVSCSSSRLCCCSTAHAYHRYMSTFYHHWKIS